MSNASLEKLRASMESASAPGSGEKSPIPMILCGNPNLIKQVTVLQ